MTRETIAAALLAVGAVLFIAVAVLDSREQSELREYCESTGFVRGQPEYDPICDNVRR
jgi:hypothetical protein